MIYTYRARVLTVYDADTVRVDVDLGLSTWRHNEPLRLAGINAPELRGPEATAGRTARTFLLQLLGELPAPVLLHTLRDSRGKYGRYLGVLFARDFATVNQLPAWTHSVNVALLSARHAVPAWYGTDPLWPWPH